MICSSRKIGQFLILEAILSVFRLCIVLQAPPVSQLQYSGAQLKMTQQQYNCSSSSSRQEHELTSSSNGSLVVGGMPTLKPSLQLIAPVVIVAHNRPDYLAQTMGHLLRWGSFGGGGSVFGGSVSLRGSGWGVTLGEWAE